MKKSLLGKKVVITGKGSYPEYAGEIGTIVGGSMDNCSEESRAVIVELGNGNKIVPYLPHEKNAECEWYTESVKDTGYSIEEAIAYARGKKVAIEIPTEELWQQIGEYDTDDSKLNNYRWSNYGGDSCIEILENRRMQYAGKDWFQKYGYEIITIKTSTMNTKEELQAQIEQMEKNIQEMKKKVSEIDNPVYKVGEWVTIEKTDSPNPGKTWYDNQTGLKIGESFCIKEIKDALSEAQWLYPEKGNSRGVESPLVRKATPAEIAKANTPKEYKLPIGTDREVTVKKSGITAHDGTHITGKALQYLINQLNTGYKINEWHLNIKTVKIGCVDGIDVTQLQKIMDTYTKLQD